MKRSSVLFTELDRRLSLSNNNQNKRKYKEENKKCRKNRQREKQRDFDKVNNKIFQAFLVEDFLHFFFFFWRARVEDYPPRGFIVGSHFVSPEGANIFPSLYAPSRAAP